MALREGAGARGEDFLPRERFKQHTMHLFFYSVKKAYLDWKTSGPTGTRRSGRTVVFRFGPPERGAVSDEGADWGVALPIADALIKHFPQPSSANDATPPPPFGGTSPFRGGFGAREWPP